MAEAKAAFLTLKSALVTAPLLQLPDFTKRFIVDCDASGAGFCAVPILILQPPSCSSPRQATRL